MRRIYPLGVGRTFDEIAAALGESRLELAEVVSCTFPGRPEPRSARWESTLGAELLRYDYLPDIELRCLRIVSPDFALLADSADPGLGPFLEAQLGGPWFDDWPALRADLHAGEHAGAPGRRRVPGRGEVR